MATDKQVRLVLDLFRNLDFPVLIIDGTGRILAASRGAISFLPHLGFGMEPQSFFPMLEDPPDSFSGWLKEACFTKSVRLRYENMVVTPTILVTAQPVEALARGHDLWILNLHRTESFSRQKYEREILLRISSVPIPEMTKEGRTLTPEDVSGCSITREMLGLIVKYLNGDCTLLVRLRDYRSLEVIGQFGFSDEPLISMIKRMDTLGDRLARREELIGTALREGNAFTLYPAELKEGTRNCGR